MSIRAHSPRRNRMKAGLWLKNAKITLFCFRETNLFRPYVIVGVAMNKIGTLMDCRRRISPVRPTGPIRLFQLSQKPSEQFWTPVAVLWTGAVKHTNALL